MTGETPRDVFLVAGEKSGDELGYKLMRALRDACGGQVRLRGVGGEAMEREGLTSLFPQSDIAVMGFLPVIARLPTLLRRIRETADAVIALAPLDGFLHERTILDTLGTDERESPCAP